MGELVTETEREAMAQRIWTQTKTDIENSVSSAIRQELRMDMSSRTKRIVGSEIDKLLRPAIEARMEDLKMVVEKTLDKLFQKVEAAAMDALESKVGYHVDGMFDQVGKQIALDMKRAAHGIITSRRREVEVERAAARQAAKEAQKP